MNEKGGLGLRQCRPNRDASVQLESLQEQVAELRASRDEQDVSNRQREQQQQEKLTGLRKELEMLSADADDAQRRLDGWTELRSNVLRGIEALFHLVKCDNSPLLELLGEWQQLATASGGVPRMRQV